ncbi:expressed unknown protein [Seminavis robusta]|uniref:Plastid lipid-associated protein/fibrillin conserved domain-containing protein n=1 Tax=Seminavis robusta TaxID=568900 RepID=A0A9N8ESD0_9STRA|nr:expressed unknown protein [Seminavis robusta]|eukprot:Sro1741_g294670.1 n/a (357) ;mRNA; r:15812-16988
MKPAISLLALSALQLASPFQVLPYTTGRQSTRFFSTLDDTDAPSMDKQAITAGPRENVLSVANGLKEKFGVFIIDKAGQEELRDAVADLEAAAELPSFNDDVKETMLGDWTLVCTTTSNSALPSPIGSGVDTSKLPFFNISPIKDLRESLNKCLVVQQSILAEDSQEINRVDHILEYKPPNNLQEVLEKLPALPINPLDVTKGKGVLVHEADVSNTGPGFSIRLKLASIVLNVAGTSQYLDPAGKDVLGINSPLKEFQAGTFETTYLDDDLRISRTTMGSVDQLRVYVRSAEEVKDYLDEEYFDEFDKFGMEDDEEVVTVEVVEEDETTDDSEEKSEDEKGADSKEEEDDKDSDSS